MTQLVVKQGCDRCCAVIGKLSYRARKNVVALGDSDCCGFLGLGDAVEAVIHLFGLHKLWARLHGRELTWVCPGCQKRKNWLNKHFYYGNKEHKALWLALVSSDDLAVNSQYPFLAMKLANGGYRFRTLSDNMVMHAGAINDLLEEENE